jgi:hypothetical protein
MGDHFGIGIGDKAIAGGDQFVLEFLVIFDDAVMHHRHRIVAEVGMGVALAGFAVGGPAGVGDAQRPAHRFLLQAFRQHLHLADRAQTGATGYPAVQGDDTRRVIAAIFQPPQPFEQDGVTLRSPIAPTIPHMVF